MATDPNRAINGNEAEALANDQVIEHVSEESNHAPRQWAELIADVKAAIGEEPTSNEVQILARRWVALAEDAMSRDPDSINGAALACEESRTRPIIPSRQVCDSHDPTAWPLIQRAIRVSTPGVTGDRASALIDQLITARLLLRRWRDSDREPFARISADPRVMRYFPSLLSRAASDAMIDSIEARFESHGFGLYAAELRQTGQFIGCIGLSSLTGSDFFFAPCITISWRLDPDFWGQGLASEGAREALRHALDDLRMPEVVAFTVPENLASCRVMEKIGMTRNLEDGFEHPRLPEGHPLRRHVLYRKKAV